MFEITLRRIVLVCAFLVLCVPFIVTSSTFFPFIVGKAILFRVIVEVMFGAWLILALTRREYRPQWTPVMIAAVSFLAIIGLADMFGANPLRSFWSNFERMEGFVMLLHVGAYIFVMGTMMRSEKLWSWFFNISISVSTVLSLYSFSELKPSFPGELIRVDATLGNPAYFAVYLLINIFITAFLAYRSLERGQVAVRDRAEHRTRVGIYVVAGLIQLVALYYSGTRGAFVGLFGGIGLSALIVLIGGATYPRMRRIAGIGIGLVILIGAVFFSIRHTAFVQNNPTLERIANVSLTDTTVQSRITLWTSIGWNAFKERPLLGWGQDNFIVAFGKYYDPIMYKQEPWFDRAHNVFMDWMIAGGILGLMGYLFLFGAGLVMLWKSTLTLPEKAVLTGLFGAYAFNNFFVFDNLVSYSYFATMLAYVHVRTVYKENEAFPVPLRETTDMKSNRLAVTGGVIVLTIVVMWFAAGRPFARAQTLLEAIQTDYSTKDAAQVLPVFEKALAYGSITGLDETREQLSQSAIRSFNSDIVAPEARTALIRRAYEELSTSVLREPGNTRPLYFLGHLLIEAGQPAEAEAVFKQALAINPARQNFLYELAKTYLDRGDFESVIATMKAAYEAEPENETAFGYYSGALMVAGRIDEGEALLMDRFGTTTVDNEYVIKAYTEADRVDKVAAILELRLAEGQFEPQKEAGMRVSLAILYLELERSADAIVQLERAIELYPPFTEQGTQMIEAVRAGRKIQIK